MADNVVDVQERLDRAAAAKQKQADEAWLQLLAPSGGGFVGDERNVLIALRAAPELKGLVRFNEFALHIEYTRTPPWHRPESASLVWNEADDTMLVAWLQAKGIKVRGTGTVSNCITVAAQDASFHPVRAFLLSLEWDQEQRLKTWLKDYLGAVGSAEYLSTIGLRFMVSAVARIMRPGCQADHSLVLEGAQGVGKSSAARALALRPDWFAGHLPSIESKDACLQLCGRWIIEIAELKAIRTSQIEATKTFLSQCVDVFRPPYGRRTAHFPRQCVFIGTTNETMYLRDRTGNRRFWPVHCQKINVADLTRDCEQLWAESVHEFSKGTQWHLTVNEAALAEEQQHERVHVSETEHDVREYLDKLAAATSTITVHDVLVYGLRLDPDKSTYTETARRIGPAVADAMEQCGWQKDGRQGKQRRTTYRRRQG